MNHEVTELYINEDLITIERDRTSSAKKITKVTRKQKNGVEEPVREYAHTERFPVCVGDLIGQHGTVRHVVRIGDIQVSFSNPTCIITAQGTRFCF